MVQTLIVCWSTGLQSGGITTSFDRVRCIFGIVSAFHIVLDDPFLNKFNLPDYDCDIQANAHLAHNSHYTMRTTSHAHRAEPVAVAATNLGSYSGGGVFDAGRNTG
jgi:hypothetical protein